MTPREQMSAAAAREREKAAIERERLLQQGLREATWRDRHPFLYALVLGLIPVGIALIAVIGVLLAD